MELYGRVKSEEAGRTLESFLRQVFGLSRHTLRRLKQKRAVTLNGRPAHYKTRLSEGDEVRAVLTTGQNEIKPPSAEPQPIPLDIAYEDSCLLVVNKPAGMLVHPVKREPFGTLANAVVYRLQSEGCEPVFRPVTRLDRDTSGLVVIAKNAHIAFLLAGMLHTKDFFQEYLAVVHGRPFPEEGCIDLSVAPRQKGIIKQSLQAGGRRAVTHYRVEKRLSGFSLLRVWLETGRTHQIRLHFSSIGCPLVGDELYGGRPEGIGRQALHCRRVRLLHPIDGSVLDLTAPFPPDMAALLRHALKN